LILSNDKKRAEATQAENTSKYAEYTDVQKEADEYRQNLAVAKQIIDNEVSYTDTIFAITETLPKGAVLDSINLTPNDIGGQTSLTVHAKDLATASALKSNFERSSKFSNAHFQ